MTEKILTQLEDFPLKSYDKIRYCDTDQQGHVNNALFSTFLETGRVELFHNIKLLPGPPGTAIVIVNLKLDFLEEIMWPGTVDIGTAVIRIGSSSITILQHVYQEERLCARAETVIVQMDTETRKSSPISTETRAQLQTFELQR